MALLGAADPRSVHFGQVRPHSAPPLETPDAGLSTSRPSHAQRQASVLLSAPRWGFSLVLRAEEYFTSVHDAGEFTANSEASSW